MPTPRHAPASQNSVAEFCRGAGDLWRGFGLLLRHPGLWVWAVIPFALNILFFALLGWGIWHFAGSWLHQHFFAPEDGFWMVLLGWIVGVLLWAAVALLAFFTFVPLATLIATPFNDILSEKVEKIYAGASVREGFSLRTLTRAIAIGVHSSLRLTLLTLVLLAGATALNLFNFVVPGVGSMLATAASAAITIRFISLQYTAYSMDRRFYTYAQRRAFLKRHRARTIGMGAMAFAVMLVPVVNALFIPVSAVAGTLLFCDTQLDAPVGPGIARRL